MPPVKIHVSTEIDLDIGTAAQWFASLTDDDQCRFLVAVAAESKKWPDAEGQWYYLGGHLKTCACSTEDAREMVRSWAHWMENSDHK